MERKKISVVVSVYNEELSLNKFYQVTEKILESCAWDYEMIFVNDGSVDRSIEILKEEDEFINLHKTHVDEMVESIKQQMAYINEVDKPGSDILEYTSGVDKLLIGEIRKIEELRNKLGKFRIMLK